MSDKLKPCPFCGSEELELLGCSKVNFIGCGKCHCDSAMKDTQAAAIAAWNTRVDPVKAQLVDALKAIRDFDLEYEFNEPVNEWLESRGFSTLQDLARKALADAEEE